MPTSGTVENKASGATTTLHLCRSDGETGSGVGTHKTQTEITIVALAGHTDRPIHRNKLSWVFRGTLFIQFIIVVVFVFCCLGSRHFKSGFFKGFESEATLNPT